MLTHGEMIDRVSNQLLGTFSLEELVSEIIRQYENLRNINVDSLKTDVAGCSVNLLSHRHLPDLPLCLVHVFMGLYRRYDPVKDKSLNLYL